MGLNLGITFQVVDDILDYTGDERELGKEVCADLREGRITLPLIHALAQASPADRERLAAIAQDLTPESAPELRSLLDQVPVPGLRPHRRPELHPEGPGKPGDLLPLPGKDLLLGHHRRTAGPDPLTRAGKRRVIPGRAGRPGLPKRRIVLIIWFEIEPV